MSEFYEIITLKALIGLQWELKFLDILCRRRNVRARKRFDRIMKHFIEFARRARTSNGSLVTLPHCEFNHST